jgi:hypothetical protein
MRTAAHLGLDLVSAQLIPAVLLEELAAALVAAHHHRLHAHDARSTRNATIHPNLQL